MGCYASIYDKIRGHWSHRSAVTMELSNLVTGIKCKPNKPWTQLTLSRQRAVRCKNKMCPRRQDISRHVGNDHPLPHSTSKLWAMIAKLRHPYTPLVHNIDITEISFTILVLPQHTLSPPYCLSFSQTA